MLKSIGLFITLVFMMISLNIQAQEYNSSPNKNDGDSKMSQDPFVPKAAKLSEKLQSKINLDDDQMHEVRDLLIKYKSKIRDLQGIQMAADRDIKKERAAARSKNSGTVVKDRTETKTGSHSTSETSGLTPEEQADIVENLRDNDVETNKDIEDVLNENQKSAWLNYKNTWWKEVKKDAYGVENFDPRNMDPINLEKK